MSYFDYKAKVEHIRWTDTEKLRALIKDNPEENTLEHKAFFAGSVARAKVK